MKGGRSRLREPLPPRVRAGASSGSDQTVDLCVAFRVSEDNRCVAMGYSGTIRLCSM